MIIADDGIIQATREQGLPVKDEGGAEEMGTAAEVIRVIVNDDSS